MIGHVVLLGLLSASPLSVQIAGVSLDATDKLETAYAACVWERKPELAKLLVEKGMVNDPDVVAANKEAFATCKDVYIDNSVTPDGQPVMLVPEGFMAKLRDLDPERPQTLSEELKELRESWDKEGDS